MNVNFERFLKQAKFHALAFMRGLGRTVYGAFIAGLIAFAVYGFVIIQTEDGYAAVFDFVASCAVLVIALCNVYLLGSKRKGGRK